VIQVNHDQDEQSICKLSESWSRLLINLCFKWIMIKTNNTIKLS